MSTYLERYERGEREVVWRELVSLGASIRHEAIIDDARAVARATMRRVRTNIELLIERLDELHFDFWDGQQGPKRKPLSGLQFGDQRIEAADTRELLDAMFDYAIKRPATALTNVMIEQLHNVYRQLVWPWQDTERLMHGERHPADAAVVEQFELAKKTPPQIVAKTMLKGMIELANISIVQMETASRSRNREMAKDTADHRKDRKVFTPPSRKDAAAVRRLEKAGVQLPLALVTWIEDVGGVNLCGAHAKLCPWDDGGGSSVFADPLMIAIDMSELTALFVGKPDFSHEIVIGWDARTKARLKVDDVELDFGYSVTLPQVAMDAPLIGAPRGLTIVEYLRHSFAWGGFPGWAGRPLIPASEISKLTRDLLPI